MEKKIPTKDQLNEYRQFIANINGATAQRKLDKLIEKIADFESEFDIFCKEFIENGKYGVKDAVGEVLVPALFDDVTCVFSDWARTNAVPVVRDNKVAFAAADGKGTLLTDFIYDAANFSEGYYVLLKDGKYGMASPKGRIVVPAEMDEIYRPMNDLVTFKKDGKYGFAMICEGLITKPEYESYDFEDNDAECLVVTKDGVEGYIDENANFTTESDDSYFHASWDVD